MGACGICSESCLILERRGLPRSVTDDAIGCARRCAFSRHFALSSCPILGMHFTQAIGYIIGYLSGSILHAFYAFAAGSVLVLLIVVPPWPMYNKHAVRWLPVRTEDHDDERKGQ